MGEREAKGREVDVQGRSLSLARCSLARSLSAAGDLRRRGEGGRGGNGIRRSNAASESNLGILARWLQGFGLPRGLPLKTSISQSGKVACYFSSIRYRLG